MSHTSGPWEFRHVAALPLTITDAKGSVIAFVDPQAHRRGEAMANGHLLKAAPVLLAACEGVFEWFDMHGGALSALEGGTELEATVLAAIAKAKGETP